MKKQLRIAITGVISLSMVALATPGAVAFEDETESVASLVAQVAPDDGATLKGAVSAEGVGFQAGSVEVDIPHDSSQGVVFASEGEQLTVQLPHELSVERATVADDGTVVYLNEGRDADVAVQTLEDGSVRMQTIIPSADATHTFSYQFDEGVSLVQGPEGIELRRESEGVAVSLGVIAPAWARDAAGNEVETTYQVEGTTLIQVVEASDATAYPVVADPRISFGRGVYFYGFGAEWIALSAALVASGGGVVVGACLIVNIPNPWAAILKAGCGTIGASNLNNYLNWVKSTVNNSKLQRQTCYELHRFTSFSGPKAVAQKHCLGG